MRPIISRQRREQILRQPKSKLLIPLNSGKISRAALSSDSIIPTPKGERQRGYNFDSLTIFEHPNVRAGGRVPAFALARASCRSRKRIFPHGEKINGWIESKIFPARLFADYRSEVHFEVLGPLDYRCTNESAARYTGGGACSVSQRAAQRRTAAPRSNIQQTLSCKVPETRPEPATRLAQSRSPLGGRSAGEPKTRQPVTFESRAAGREEIRSAAICPVNFFVPARRRAD